MNPSYFFITRFHLRVYPMPANSSGQFYEHNDNDETQEDVHADEDASSSSSTVSPSSSKQGQSKSTNETAQVASIYMHTQNDFSKDLASEKLRYVIGLWIHFLWQALILHIKNNASVQKWKWRPALLKGAVWMCTPFAIMIGCIRIVTTRLLLLSMSAGSTANVIKGGCSSKQAKFCVLKMDVSVLNMDVSQDQPWGQIPLDR